MLEGQKSGLIGEEEAVRDGRVEIERDREPGCLCIPRGEPAPVCGGSPDRSYWLPPLLRMMVLLSQEVREAFSLRDDTVIDLADLEPHPPHEGRLVAC